MMTSYSKFICEISKISYYKLKKGTTKLRIFCDWLNISFWIIKHPVKFGQ